MDGLTCELKECAMNRSGRTSKEGERVSIRHWSWTGACEFKVERKEQSSLSLVSGMGLGER